jgi:hypothetical protein
VLTKLEKRHLKRFERSIWHKRTACELCCSIDRKTREASDRARMNALKRDPNGRLIIPERVRVAPRPMPPPVRRSGTTRELSVDDALIRARSYLVMYDLVTTGRLSSSRAWAVGEHEGWTDRERDYVCALLDNARARFEAARQDQGPIIPRSRQRPRH